MKARMVLVGPVVGIALVTALGPARAEGLRLGGSISLLPIGQIELAVDDQSESVDTEMAVGFGGVIEYQLHPNFAIGLTPRVILNVKGEDADESAKEVDLMLRLIGNGPIGTNMQLYGFAAPGYSIIYPPDWPDELDHPAGFLLGFGAGVGFDLNPQFRLAAELGYQFGGQKVSEGGETLDVKTSFLHLGAVAMAKF